MKRSNSIQTITAMLVAAVMLLASCAQNDLTEADRPQPPAGMGELTLGHLQLLGSETAAQSRAGTPANLPAGSTLRLYAFAEGETDFGSTLATRTYTIDATGAAQLDAEQEPLYLPVGKADIYLAGPVEHNTGTQATPVMEEVAAEWGIYPRIGADLIATYAQATIVAGNTNALPSMTLEHKMARAQIVVEANQAAVYENLVVKEIKLYGQPTTGRFTLDNTGGVITADQQQLEEYVFSSVTKDQNADKYSATTVLIPQAERELKVETTFECNQKNVDAGDNHPTLQYRQSGLVTAPLTAGTATRFSAAPITPVEIKWRTKVLPWNQMQGEDLVVEGPETNFPYVEINGLKWTTGNLVAYGANDCRVGEPGDGGLYFQYGGLIGYKGGANGDGIGIVDATTHADNKYWSGAATYSANDVAVTPMEYTKQATWPYFEKASGGWGYYYFTNFMTKHGDFQSQGNANNPTLGIGDPCAYYLGSPWRLPTYKELAAITGSATGGSWVSWSTATVTGKWLNAGPKSAIGAWLGPNSKTGTPTDNTDLFIPASGYRLSNDGGFRYAGKEGSLWSSSINDAKSGISLIVGTQGVIPHALTSRAFAFPVRCVKN